MAQQFRSASASGGMSSASRTISEGSGWAQGDVILALAVGDGDSMSPGLPAGWTEISSGNEGLMSWVLGWIARGSSAPDLTFTTGQASSRFFEVQAVAFSGVDTTSPIQASTVGSTGTSTNRNPDPPNLSSAGSNVLIVAGGINSKGPTTTWSPGANYTIRSDNNRMGIIVSRTSDALTSGAQDPPAFSGVLNDNAYWWDGFTIALAAASAGGVTGSLAAAESGSDTLAASGSASSNGIRLTLRDTDTGALASNLTSVKVSIRTSSDSESTLAKSSSKTTDSNGVLEFASGAIGSVGTYVYATVEKSDNSIVAAYRVQVIDLNA